MDAMTTRMCKQGIGRLGYARVLVEVDAKKGLEDHIDVLYRSSSNGEQFVKKVNVEYDWKPPICKKCMVFGHSDNNCNRKDKTKEQVLEQNVNENVINDVRKTANKFAILQDIEEEDGFATLSMKEKEEVDKYVLMTLQPSQSATNKWSKEMKEYFKENWKKQQSKEEDMDLNIAAWNIRGLGKVTKQNEVKNLMRNEKLSICAVLETHMKKSRIDKVYMNVFGSWFWQNNEVLSRKGWRLAVSL
ncbi:RNA-directed DNA polymerase, eukaryota, reverse transcriptase zinc-binding domain protein [Tanacetum coccineum]